MGLFYLLLLFLPLLVFRPKDVFQPEAAVNGYYLLFIAIGPIALSLASPDQFASGQYFFSATLVLLGYLSMNVGFGIANVTRKRRAYAPVGVNPPVAGRIAYKVPAVMLLAVAGLALGFFFIRAGVPLLAENKEAARVDALNIAGNGYLLYLATLGIPAVLLVACGSYARRRSGSKPLRLDIFLALLAVLVGLALMGTGSRRYFFWCVLYVLIARHYLFRRVRVGFMVVATLLGFVSVNLFEMYRNALSNTTTDLLTASYYRLIVYFYNLEATFTAFEKAELMYGSTFVMDLVTIMPGKQIDYQSWIKAVTGLEFEGFGVPPTIVGDMYINFGYAGIVLGCMFFGWLLKSFYFRKVRAMRRTALDVFIYALVLEISIRTLTSGFSAQAIGYVWITLVYLFVRGAGQVLTPLPPPHANRPLRIA